MRSAKANRKPLKKTSLFQYGFLAFPLAFASLPLYIHAPDFYSRNLGLDIGLMGFILLFVRTFDAVQDPVIGYLSDRFASKRFAILFVGCLLLSLGMATIFYGAQFGVSLPVWFAVSLIFATSGFSVAVINLNMIGGFWREDQEQRTVISAWREGFSLLGLLVASILPAILQNIMSAESSYRILFWVFAIFTLISIALFYLFQKNIGKEHDILKAHTKKRPAFFSILFGADRNFFGVCFLAHLAASLPGILVLFYIRDYLNAEALTGLFLILYFLSGAVFMPIWVRLAGKIGKNKAWFVSMVLAVVTFVWAFFLQAGDVWQYGIICVLSGTTFGADLSLPPSIIADYVSEKKAQSESTQYYALLAFIPKIALALASGLSFIVLDMVGFKAGVENSAFALSALAMIYALVPCGIKLIASITLWFTYIKQEKKYD